MTTNCSDRSSIGLLVDKVEKVQELTDFIIKSTESMKVFTHLFSHNAKVFINNSFCLIKERSYCNS